MENKMMSVDLDKFNEKQLNNRRLWIVIYIFVGILLTSIVLFVVSVVTTSMNVQQLNQISKSGFGGSINVPLSFRISLSEDEMSSLKDLKIINLDEIAREFESTFEMGDHPLSFSLIKLKQFQSDEKSRKRRSMEEGQSWGSDTVLRLETVMDNSVCGSVSDCQSELYRRFIRSVEKNENGSLPLTLLFHNGNEVRTNIIVDDPNPEDTQKLGRVLKPSVNKCSASKSYDLFDTSIEELQNGLKKNHFTSVDLVKAYIARINEVNLQGPRLRAVIEISPTALQAAEKADALRKRGKILSPVHGIPILVKDSISTRPEDGMNTTAGSFALVGSITSGDSTVVKKLRDGGAIILGKTALSEWGNFRGFTVPNGWSGRGGQATSAFYPQGDACGSSTGSGIAASIGLAGGTLGTETDGSIMCPSSFNNVVGIKPTVGLVSRNLVIPLSRNQDTIGPMCRSVGDAAAILSVIAGRDSEDNYTLSQPAKVIDYTKHLKKNGLKGARIGVLRKIFTNSSIFEYPDYIIKEFNRTIEEVFKNMGAVIIDPADLDTIEEILFSESELTMLLFEFKYGIGEYLSKLKSIPTNVSNLQDIIDFNNANAALELPPGREDQRIFLLSENTTNFQDPIFVNAVATNIELGRTRGIDATLKKYKLDALIGPSIGITSAPAALAGYPMITVPLGFLPPDTPVLTNEIITSLNLPIPFPPNLPFGISFIGRGYSEGRLIELAYSYERATLNYKKGKPFQSAIPKTQLSDIVCQNKVC